MQNSITSALSSVTFGGPTIVDNLTMFPLIGPTTVEREPFYLTLDEATVPYPCAWVLGHEGQGISATRLTRCAHTLRIPQPGGEESLNVAAAAAICLYATRRAGGWQ